MARISLLSELEVLKSRTQFIKINRLQFRLRVYYSRNKLLVSAQRTILFFSEKDRSLKRFYGKLILATTGAAPARRWLAAIGVASELLLKDIQGWRKYWNKAFLFRLHFMVHWKNCTTQRMKIMHLKMYSHQLFSQTTLCKCNLALYLFKAVQSSINNKGIETSS